MTLEHVLQILPEVVATGAALGAGVMVARANSEKGGRKIRQEVLDDTGFTPNPKTPRKLSPDGSQPSPSGEGRQV